MTTEYRVVPVELLKLCMRLSNIQGLTLLRQHLCDLLDAAPVPPAGREPEVVASVHGAGYSDHPPMTHWLEIGVEKMPMSGKIETGEKLIFLKDHRTHVTRLQAAVGTMRQRKDLIKDQRNEYMAERDALKAEVERLRGVVAQARDDADDADKERSIYKTGVARLKNACAKEFRSVEYLQSELTKAQESALLDRHEAWKAGELHGLNTVNAELTKARELLHKAGNLMWEMYLGSPTDKVCDAVEDFLNGPYGPPPDQSAPAAKDGE